jgi:hypothetical protein
MIVNLDYLKERYRSEQADTESYGVYIEMEAFTLIRELIKAIEETQNEIVSLRRQVNDLTQGEPVYPYPAHDIPGQSFYITELIAYLYKLIFKEELDR